MPPHAGVLVEIRIAVSRAVRIVPEPDRHRRHGRDDDELAHLFMHLPARGVEAASVHPETRRGQLAEIDRQPWRAGDEGAAHIGTTSAGVKPDLASELVVDPFPRCWWQ